MSSSNFKDGGGVMNTDNKYDFAAWVKKFRDAGFHVELVPHVKYDSEFNEIPEIEYWEGWVTGKGIKGIFGCGNSSNPYTQARFAADHEDCFDKVQKCPLVVKLPCDFDDLMGHLALLGSEEGFEISNNYNYMDNNPFPYEVAR